MSLYELWAVKAINDRLASDLAAKLDWVEGQWSGFSSGELGDQDKITLAFVPTANDPGPVIEIYDDASFFQEEDGGQRNRVCFVDCTIAIKYSGVTDLEVNEEFMRGYVAAVREAIESNHTLATSPVVLAWCTDADRSYPLVDEATTRHVRAVGVRCQVFYPTES